MAEALEAAAVAWMQWAFGRLPMRLERSFAPWQGT